MQPVAGYENVVQAVATLHQPQSDQQQRRAAVQLLEQLKRGDAHRSAELGVALIGSNNPVEVQLAGYQLLTYLAAGRWQDFNDSEHANLVHIAVQQLQTVATLQAPWPLKSHSAVLLAAVLKQQGADALTTILPQLLAFGQGGLMNTQLVCIVLKHVAEEVTQYHDDMSEEAKRKLLSALTSSLSSVLPFLVTTMERHFGEVMRLMNSGQQSEAEQHGTVVTSALGTAAAYCEWAPLGRVAGSGVVQAAAFLINTLEFRDAACEVMRQVAQRKKSTEEKEVYCEVMQEVGVSLVRAASSLLVPGEVDQLDYEGRHDEFGQRLCDTMVTFGTQHFNCIGAQDTQTQYLQEMMQFVQHRYLLLSNIALPFWVDLLRAVADKKQHMYHINLPAECVAALMDLAGAQMYKGVHLEDKAEDMPPYFDDFQEYKLMCTTYRSKLVQVVRSTALLLPDQALGAASRRVDSALAACSAASSTPYSEQQTQLEASVTFLEAVVVAVADKHVSDTTQSQHKQAVLNGMEAIFQRLLGHTITDPYLLFFHAKGLDTFHTLLQQRPQLVAPTIQKVFDMMSAIPINGETVPPPKVNRQWKDAFNARQKIAGVLLTVSKQHAEVLVPHLAALAAQVASMWSSGQLRAGERNSLSECMLATGRAVDGSMQGQILDWVLSPVREEWRTQPFQQSVSSPGAFAATYMGIMQDAAGGVQVSGGAARWSLYHHLHLLFRTTQRLATWSDADMFPTHVAWALPTLLSLCSCMHTLSTPQMQSQLTAISAAFDMSPAEKALYLKQGGQLMKAVEEDMGDTLASPTITALRNWLRNVREVLYQCLGSLHSLAPALYSDASLCAAWREALLKDVEHLSNRDVRILLRHIMHPLMKTTPYQHRDAWLLPLAQTLVPHMHARLTASWATAASVSAPPGSSTATSEDAAAANEEIIQSRILAELTREHAALLALMADKTATQGPESLLEWLLQRDTEVGFTAVNTAAQALSWPDTAMQTCAQVCRAVVSLAPQDQRLYTFVGGHMLTTAITGLSLDVSLVFQADILQVIRDILVQQLGKAPGPREVLLLLPHVDDTQLSKLEAKLKSTGSEKEQRNAIKQLLVSSGGSAFVGLPQWSHSTKGNAIQICEPTKRSARTGPSADDSPTALGVSQLFNSLLDGSIVM